MQPQRLVCQDLWQMTNFQALLSLWGSSRWHCTWTPPGCKTLALRNYSPNHLIHEPSKTIYQHLNKPYFTIPKQQTNKKHQKTTPRHIDIQQDVLHQQLPGLFQPFPALASHRFLQALPFLLRRGTELGRVPRPDHAARVDLALRPCSNATNMAP